jgi:hypothetical protein
MRVTAVVLATLVTGMFVVPKERTTEVRRIEKWKRP